MYERMCSNTCTETIDPIIEDLYGKWFILLTLFCYQRPMAFINSQVSTNQLTTILRNYKLLNSGEYLTNLYDKRYEFKFPIVNLPFKCSNIPTVPT